jgi:predicted CXXCH cytochrome family protein
MSATRGSTGAPSKPARDRRARLALLGLVVIAGLPSLRAGAGTVRVLYPADGSILDSGRFTLICLSLESAAAPSLKIDRTGAKWEPYELPVLVGQLELAPGPHEIAIGSTRVRVHVRGSPPSLEPDGWPTLRRHGEKSKVGTDCAACHELKRQDAKVIIGDSREPASCRRCHAAKDLEAAHVHALDPLVSCRMCHALHGSSRPRLLRADVKELCARCHE